VYQPPPHCIFRGEREFFRALALAISFFFSRLPYKTHLLMKAKNL
jgi:hypothetical protein